MVHLQTSSKSKRVSQVDNDILIDDSTPQLRVLHGACVKCEFIFKLMSVKAIV